MPRDSAFAFADIERRPQEHFRLLLCAGAFRLAAHLRGVTAESNDERLFQTYPVLRDYLALCRGAMPDDIGWDEIAEWWRGQITRWEQSTRAWLPLRELRRASDTGFEGEVAAVLAACVEEDPRLGSVFAQLQGSPGSRRPTLGLLEALTDVSELVPVSTAERLIRGGWLLVDDASLPRAERHVRLPVGVWDVIQEREPDIAGARLYSYRAAAALRSFVLEPELRAEVERIPALLSGGEVRTVAVRGPESGGRLALLRALLRSLRRHVLVFDWPEDGRTPTHWNEIGAACRIGRIAPVARLRSAPGQAIELRRPQAYAGPLGLVLGGSGGIRGEALEDAVFIELDIPGPEARAELWRRALPREVSAPHQRLGADFRVPGGIIARAARSAAAYARVSGHRNVEPADARRALSALNRHALESLAQRLEPDGGWEDLYVGSATRAELRDLELRCRYREELPEVAGSSAAVSLTRGVRALLVGPSGTGKTLAARILAAVLEKDLFRVDLAAVVNKYIGETEKNLDQVLSRAEELDVVLLLDEGDALMTARTDVRTSNDRYANLETNYLLQRLETYEGIIVVTTNAGQRIDAAFLRRIDHLIEFQPPGVDERAAIWRAHLPAGHHVTDALLEQVADRAALTGGQIRNAAIHATLLALDRSPAAAVSDADLEQAVRREYRKAGGTYPLAEPAADLPGVPPARRLDQVLAALRP